MELRMYVRVANRRALLATAGYRLIVSRAQALSIFTQILVSALARVAIFLL